jgi:hypothetical protein
VTGEGGAERSTLASAESETTGDRHQLPRREFLTILVTCDVDDKEYCGVRDLAVARKLNPALQTFEQWLAQTKGRIPLE